MTWGYLIAEWFLKGYSAERIEEKSGLKLAFIEGCIERFVQRDFDAPLA